MHGPFNFGFADHGSDGARETLGVGAVDLFGAASMLGNLWQRMQVR